MHDKRRGGYTLVELLCVLVVLLLVSMLLAVGVRLSVQSYVESVSCSEAQTLCSTLTTAVSDELRYSGSLLLDADGTPQAFFSQSYANAEDANGLAGFSQDESGHVLLGGNKFLPNKAYPRGLAALVTLTGYDMNTRVFHVRIEVTRNSKVLAETEFDVQQLNTPVTYYYTDGTSYAAGSGSGG